jgi:predicted metal-binding membrane protein
MSEAVLEAILRRDRAIVIAALATLTVLAWAYIVWMAGTMNSDMSDPAMSDMNMGGMLAPAFRPWLVTHIVFVASMWVVMMIGMMTPSAGPMILLYARVSRQAVMQGKALAATGFFAGGYLLAWVVFSLFATTGQWMLERAVLLTPMMAAAGGAFGGVVLIAAGIFQWTPWKDACLKHCQAPLAFIQHHGGFQRDPATSLVLGLRHGLYCVGCCWALMALLFAGGIMNILWIAMLTIFVFLEKLVPAGRLLTRSAGLGLIVWGSWLLSSTTH